MVTLEHGTLLHLPTLYTSEEDGINYAVDPAKPNWIAMDEKGRELLEAITGSGDKVTFGALVAHYAAAHQLEAGKAWVHVHDFLRALNRAGMLADGPVSPPPYPGRAALIAPEGLRELWIQINNACNLSCTHCLVSSGPGKDPGLPFQRLRALVDRAVQLGLERLYLTGGEPLIRKDIFDLIRHGTESRDLEIIVLTNATVRCPQLRYHFLC